MKYVAKSLEDAAELSAGQSNLSDKIKASLSAVATIGFIILVIHFSAKLLVQNMPDGVERSMGTVLAGVVLLELDALSAEAFQDVPKESEETFNKVYSATCRTLTCRDLDYEFFYIPDPQANAFAVAGGAVVVTDTLYKQLETEAGFAFILAHELAHHNKRHVLNSIARDALWQLLLSLAGISGTEVALLFSQAAYSRTEEKEADLLALQIVYPLYEDVGDDYFEFFLHAAEDEKAHRRGFSWLDSHPNVEERITYLRAELARLKQGA